MLVLNKREAKEIFSELAKLLGSQKAFCETSEVLRGVMVFPYAEHIKTVSFDMDATGVTIYGDNVKFKSHPPTTYVDEFIYSLMKAITSQ